MIPNFLTDTFSSVAGEFANSSGPFIEGLDFDASQFPSDLVNLPSELNIQKLNPFQSDMVKTILTENGRAELFTNPHTQDILAVRTRLNNLLNSPGANATGVDLSISLGPSVTDLLETIDHFESHTDRLSGVIEPDTKTAALPTLERALAVGSSINHIHKVLDIDLKPTNSPVLSLFGSLFAGKTHFDNLKTILAKPDSDILPEDLNGISQSLTTLAENDVKNYTVAVKKLKRIGVANMVFGMKDKPVEANIISLVTTSFSKGLFQNDTTKRDADQVATTQKRLEIQAASRANTVSYNQEFKEIPDLFRAHGLFEGIPITWDIYKKITDQYPSDQPGLFNSYLSTERLTSPDQLSIYFNAPFKFKKGKFLLAIFQDYVSRQAKSNIIGHADWYFGGVLKFGSISKILLDEGWFNGSITNSLGGTVDDKIEPQTYDNGNWRRATTDEEAKLKDFVVNYPNGNVNGVNDDLLRRMRFYVYGAPFDLYNWIGSRYLIPADPTLTPPGQIYQGGIWIPPQPPKPWPPGVINYVLFTGGPNGAHWDPQYAASWTGHRDPSDAIQPS